MFKLSVWNVLPLSFFLVMIYFLYHNLGSDSQFLETELLGKPLPVFVADDLTTGREVTQQDFKGPALINIWASWCPTCIAEHHFLKKLAEQGVRIYGVNHKDSREKAQLLLSRLGNPFVLNAVDSQGHIGFDLGVYGAPETFFLDREGLIQYRHVGEISPDLWNTKLNAIFNEL
jgi:cytochrome c biogenesis protein CcmG, thiol:disulfide interchange protein DsbE